ncbi:non-canonical purine NTP pyrophosphatase [Synechococcus sp. CS-1325]|nr:non-canonical purine NTP pyrophosphatase [Synechococcus sp. CS-1325]MCT0229616.1 non-canonical purine NTP pyrophosphatase [Synechococcus sp. CS-1324]PZU98578.1 MAG: non-canonical purine NTP pyrophosphatase [Cyanobium sp.]PZV03154.1 MAG: non-canonical purine NTP pyrophosphatase [Cyanobium sp.]
MPSAWSSPSAPTGTAPCRCGSGPPCRPGAENRALAQRNELVIASGNPHKVKEITTMLDAVELTVIGQPDGLDIEETGHSYAENARLKAETVARLTGRWTLADDSGLAVDALGGAPGLFSARYAASDRERIARLLKELGDSPYRTAAFHSALALADPGGHTVLEAEGTSQGEILLQPVEVAGSHGYNSVFHVRGAGCTLAEMSDHQLLRFSSRARAARAMAPKLLALLGIGAP